jgi:hypothetical protein
VSRRDVQPALFSRDETDQRVSARELAAIRALCLARGQDWDDFMTDYYLRQRYGGRAYHVPGDGWHIRAVTP